MCIPLIGKSASKDISKACANGDIQQFIDIMSLEGEHAFIGLNGFGKEMCNSLVCWWANNKEMFYDLSKQLIFIKNEAKNIIDNPFNNKIICVTGKLNNFTRDSINEKIVSLGAKVASSVTKKTDYLLTNEASNSSKYKKAMELNIKVVSEEEFLNMLN